MGSFSLTTRFLTSACALQKEHANKTFKSLLQFFQNPRHPGLNFEKLQGCALHSIRIDQAFRIILETGHDVVILHYVGSHDEAYRIAKAIAPIIPAKLGPPRPA